MHPFLPRRLCLAVSASLLLGGCVDAAGPDDAITLAEDSAAISIGDSLRLVLTKTGAPEPVVWSSSDPSAASVDQGGMLRALNLGQTVVRAQAGTLSDSLLVTVTGRDEYRVTVLYEGELLNSRGRYPPPRPYANLNDRGQVVFSAAAGGAYLWDAGTLVPLGGSEARDINELGEIAGSAGGDAVVWNADRVPRVVYSRPDGIARAVAVNESGQVAAYWKTSGFCGVGGRCSTVTVRVTGDSTAVLTQNVLEATAMNDSGWLVGWHDPDHLFHPFVIRGTTFSELEWGGSYQYAWDINSSGVVVGSGGQNGGCKYWDAAGLHPLPGGSYDCVAMGINDAGTIVGATGATAMASPKGAAIWRDGASTPLQESIADPRWTLSAGVDINNRSQIIATATDAGTGGAFLLLLDPR